MLTMKITKEIHQTTIRREISMKKIASIGISIEARNMNARNRLPAAHLRNSLMVSEETVVTPRFRREAYK